MGGLDFGQDGSDMEKGLLWLPLLVVFLGLAWAGWREYQKVDAYRLWAESFDRAKYDIYAVLGQKGREITWGIPSLKGPIHLQTFSLDQVQTIQLRIGEQWLDLSASLTDDPPETVIQSAKKGDRPPALAFQLEADSAPIVIPFTELSLAIQWGIALYEDWQQWDPALETESTPDS